MKKILRIIILLVVGGSAFLKIKEIAPYCGPQDMPCLIFAVALLYATVWMLAWAAGQMIESKKQSI